MNIYAELARVWGADKIARRKCPVEKVFTGKVPDTYQDKEGNILPANCPFIVLWSPDGMIDGGTNESIKQVIQLQVSAFAETFGEASDIRDYARDLFEDQELTIRAPELFQDISIAEPGNLPEQNGIYECYQRFDVETSIPRPNRKRVR